MFLVLVDSCQKIYGARGDLHSPLAENMVTLVDIRCVLEDVRKWLWGGGGSDILSPMTVNKHMACGLGFERRFFPLTRYVSAHTNQILYSDWLCLF